MVRLDENVDNRRAGFRDKLKLSHFLPNLKDETITILEKQLKEAVKS